MKYYINEKRLKELLETLNENKLEILHNRKVPESFLRNRPDFIINKKFIIEFDGYRHYNNSKNIIKDIETEKDWNELGYKIFRIPYFIQIRSDIKEIISKVLNIDISKIIENDYKSGFWDEKALLPADFCELGIQRFKKDLEIFKDYHYSEVIESLKYQVEKTGNIDLVLPKSLQHLL